MKQAQEGNQKERICLFNNLFTDINMIWKLKSSLFVARLFPASFNF